MYEDANSRGKKIIIILHHAPRMDDGSAKGFRDGEMNSAFATDLFRNENEAIEVDS